MEIRQSTFGQGMECINVLFGLKWDANSGSEDVRTSTPLGCFLKFG